CARSGDYGYYYDFDYW
nr:immunoglobulin heavy chain junction region [Macaca mulatta]MOX63306.1 immunoglobulin heavy chain junction region [Macaca mulatta]MOX64269.1 immunoglobulin heavy chain junction region [Macaca mulatta]MOX65826.1 immunoglobulin heavy chain junction region [Macaca mulatta]MOX66395.1 immunoglobulin heavy chain junction region [Macaca mulatta]